MTAPAAHKGIIHKGIIHKGIIHKGIIHKGISIKPLDPHKHDRAAFSCGTARLDNFLKRTARKHQAGDFTRVWVATENGTAILGYYALNAHALEGEALPDHLTKHASRSGSIPAVYLSMIAVDHRHQGRGLGRFLLADALTRVVGAADQVGLKAVILDVIEDGGAELTERRRTFYAAMGFQSLPSRPLRMFISIETVRKARGCYALFCCDSLEKSLTYRNYLGSWSCATLRKT